MAAPRLPFLYPHLFKPIHVLESSLPSRSWSAVRKQSEALRGPKRRHQSTFPQRYGPAAEPMPPSQQNKQDIMAKKSTSKASKQDEEKARVKPTQEATSEKDASRNLDADTEPERLKSKPEAPVGSKPVIRDADEAHPQEKVEGPQLDAPSKPLEKVLHMPPPTSSKAKTDDHKLPHLQAPPYVHHFDTYTLVKDLGKGGYTQDQSITIMKAVRSLLATNLDLAKDGLVSKSDVENESYLFRAACSELRTEIQNSRASATDKMRTERAHLQHEVDILNQLVTQETLKLKDELKGMFDDRKMAVRMEQRAMESAIQELNYKITVAMAGDAKGEVEGLRWFLTRRAALVIASMAILILGSLRYSTYMAHVQELERKMMSSAFPPSSSSSSGRSSSVEGAAGASYTTPSRSTATQTTEAVLGSMEDGKEVGYVSLG